MGSLEGAPPPPAETVSGLWDRGCRGVVG